MPKTLKVLPKAPSYAPYASEGLTRELLEKKFKGQTMRQAKNEIIKVIGPLNFKKHKGWMVNKLKDMKRLKFSQGRWKKELRGFKCVSVRDEPFANFEPTDQHQKDIRHILRNHQLHEEADYQTDEEGKTYGTLFNLKQLEDAFDEQQDSCFLKLKFKTYADQAARAILRGGQDIKNYTALWLAFTASCSQVAFYCNPLIHLFKVYLQQQPKEFEYLTQSQYDEIMESERVNFNLDETIKRVPITFKIPGLAYVVDWYDLLNESRILSCENMYTRISYLLTGSGRVDDELMAKYQQAIDLHKTRICANRKTVDDDMTEESTKENKRV